MPITENKPTRYAIAHSSQSNCARGDEMIRMCMACRQFQPRQKLLRLTVDWQTGEVLLNLSASGKSEIHGRSAYLCSQAACVEQALKSNKLRAALQGGRGKKLGIPARTIKWPLEPQLIHTLRSMCTERHESCHNSVEGGAR